MNDLFKNAYVPALGRDDEIFNERMMTFANEYAGACHKAYGIDRLRCEIDFMAGAQKARNDLVMENDELRKLLNEQMRITERLISAVKMHIVK